MSYLSDFEHTKLDAQVFPGCVVQKHYISSAISGQRRVPVTKVWKVKKLLGKGTFGEVRLEACSSDDKDTNEERAVKRIWATGTEFKKSYERELKALLEFSKPKYKESAVFVEFLGWFEDLESVYLTMEYLPLGDLEESVLAAGGSIKETEVREIAVQILEGLRIMHLENFAHRDLKPKNVLVCQGPPNWWVKLADFGLSKRRTDETVFRTQAGTFAYMAPEILNYIPGVDPETSEYTNAVDMWALGCIVYRLVCGVLPFPPGPSLVKFCVNESEFPPKVAELTGLAQTFIKGLIVPYPSRRLTAQQALEHSWMRSSLKASNFESQSVSFGGYATETHPGLRSHKLATPIPVVDSGAAERSAPKTYHPPTVEDEEETGSDIGSVSVEIEEPESTIRPLPTKPESSKTNQDKTSNWGKPRRRSDESLRDPYVNIVEPPIRPAAAPKMPFRQIYASQTSTPPSRKKAGRPGPPGRDSYVIEPPSSPQALTEDQARPLPRAQTFQAKDQERPLARAQTFQTKDQARPLARAQIFFQAKDQERLPPRAQTFQTKDQAPPLPRAQTFQAKDRADNRLRWEHVNSESDSDSDTSVYTHHPIHKSSRPKIRSPTKIQPTFGQHAKRSRWGEQTRIESPEDSSISPEDWAETLEPYALMPPPVVRRVPEPTVHRVAAGRPRPRRSSAESIFYHGSLAEMYGQTIPLTQENLEKHIQTRRGRPETPANRPPSNVSYASATAGKTRVSHSSRSSCSPPRRFSVSPVPYQNAPSRRTRDSHIFYADESGHIDFWPSHPGYM